MDIKKEIVVLNGGGHKGVVKFQAVVGRSGYVKGNCSLDFRPQNCTLYLMGDNISKIALNDIKTDFEVPFYANNSVGCLVRSSSLTMFGGTLPNSKILKLADDFDRAQRQSAKSAHIGSDTRVEPACETQKPEHGKKPVQNLKSEDAQKPSDVARTVDATRAKPLEWIKYDGNNFYFAIKPQLDEMFICYPKEERLNSAVENSDWVRVDAEDGYYVVGLLFDSDKPSFICYGVPAYDRQPAPKDIENMCVWLPLDESASGGGERPVGYWVIYQSAQTGEIIR